MGLTRTEITHSALAEKYFQLLITMVYARARKQWNSGITYLSTREGYSDVGLGKPLGYTRVNAITFDNKNFRRRCGKRFGLCIIG